MNHSRRHLQGHQLAVRRKSDFAGIQGNIPPNRAERLERFHVMEAEFLAQADDQGAAVGGGKKMAREWRHSWIIIPVSAFQSRTQSECQPLVAIQCPSGLSAM
jgi:hypothetical protein